MPIFQSSLQLNEYEIFKTKDMQEQHMHWNEKHKVKQWKLKLKQHKIF